MGIGNIVKDYHQGVFAIPQAGDKFFQADIRAGGGGVHFQGDTPVVRGKLVQIVGTYPVYPDFELAGKGKNLPGPGAWFRQKDGTVGFAGFYPFLNGVKAG
jgi:hypothetical protein